ncbi:hypothetical protein EG68_02406 [Paragonimus skrjabini miyazakii]|uniref:Glycosyltransferase-like protein LARGE2 n=1 Tax=Paragonimus skrjabini miyazakii TaxID=59628 RepID=A0A8S9YYV7_9TREM|nr:hypothetical protein EG68_02406 [Paragonimus skrjabini miyazakii]
MCVWIGCKMNFVSHSRSSATYLWIPLLILVDTVRSPEYNGDLLTPEALRHSSSDQNVGPIHLFTVVKGEKTLYQALTMLKSILFFQGRYISKETTCIINWKGSSNIKGPRTHPANPTALVLHWLASEHEYRKLTEMFRHKNCSLRTVKLNLYEFEKHAQLLSKVPIKHYAGISSLLKLMVPYVVPSEVTKIILLDADILFNANIENLWAHFQQFKAHQAIGVACEQVDNCPQSCDSPGLPQFGVNTGVMLLDVSKLRRQEWRNMWIKELKLELKQNNQLWHADQGLVNQVLKKHPHLYYRLPCVWNVQVHLDSGLNCCPVYWSTTEVNSGLCSSAMAFPSERVHSACAVHFNIKEKPEMIGSSGLRNVSFQEEKTKQFTVAQLRGQFHRMYWIFREFPLVCFS